MTVEDHCKATPPSSSPAPPPPSAQEASLGAGRGAGSNSPPITFDKLAQLFPQRADQFISQVAEVTSVKDRALLKEAWNQCRFSSSCHQLTDSAFNDGIAEAINWIIETKLQIQQKQLQQQNRGDTHNKNQINRLRLQPAGTDSVMPPAVATRPDAIPSQPPNSPTLASAANDDAKKPLIDLTETASNAKGTDAKETDADLERAIQLSLQESTQFVGGNFTQEDQDVSRALEASLVMEPMSGSKRKRADTYIDPPNPHDRERNGLWPVGLKNVGQTCWFSAVIQSLFYLPVFRNLVLNFDPPAVNLNQKLIPPNGLIGPQTDVASEEDKNKKVTDLMLELRKLFSLLLATERKYVDPSKAIDILRGHIGSSNLADNQQEDVSEFTHILFEWAKEAFRTKKSKKVDEVEKMDDGCEGEEKRKEEEKESDQAEKPEQNEAENNPMAKLFFGKIQVEGQTTGGGNFLRNEEFTQLPLELCPDLHESLETYTSMDNLEDANSTSSWQERWFTVLPPVLFFSLSRFKYNVEKGAAEKLHNRLDFPEVLYMDRYMDGNKNITRVKREEVKKLKERRNELQGKLDKFTSYGNGENKLPLQSVLQYTLDFATSSPNSNNNNNHLQPPNSDCNMASPNPASSTPIPAVPSSSTVMQVDSPCPSPKMTPATSVNNLAEDDSKDEMMDVEMTEDDQETNKEIGHKEQQAPSNGCDKKVVQEFAGPYPKHISEMELRVLQSCLTRWKTEVLSDIQNLESSLSTIDTAIANMYSEPVLNRLEYRLHAVMVHEGSVNSGHYWAYVYDHKRKVWLKCNDNTVNEATWDELQKESVGGKSNASAYSLVYLDTSKGDLLMQMEQEKTTDENKMEQGLLESLIASLPNDLAEFVLNDNKAFHLERRKWDEEQERKKQEAKQRKQNDEANSELECQVVEERLTYVNTHAKLCTSVSLDIIFQLEKLGPSDGANAAQTAMNEAIKHFESLAQRPDGEVVSGPHQHPQQQFGDVRLKSFVIYLLKNNCDKILIKLAVAEQFSLPGLENDNVYSQTIRQASVSFLNRLRQDHPAEAELLKEWHQAYHLFRVSASCFVKATIAYLEEKFDEALDLYMIAYTITVKIVEFPPKGNYKTLKTTYLLKYFCHSVVNVNKNVIKQLKSGDRFPDIKRNVQQLIVPALYYLQQRVNREQSLKQQGLPESATSPLLSQVSGLDERTLETVRGQWCALLADDEVPAEANEVVSDILTSVLEPIAPKDSEAKSKNCDHISQKEDLTLYESHRQALVGLREAYGKGGVAEVAT